MTRRAGQSQKAGQGAQQIQVAGNLVLGINEERAKEIAVVTSRQVVAEFTEEALMTVQTRIDELDGRLIRTLQSRGQLDAFADPAFQRAVKKAQNSAAASERESDYDILAALLSDRAANPRHRMSMAGIDRAIEVVDLVDDDALRGLTVLHAIGAWVPASSFLGDGLDTFEKIFDQLIDGPLPMGSDWAEHLDVLGAVRVQTIGSLRSFDEFMSSTMEGYTAPGVLAEEVPEFVEDALGGQSWSYFLTDHELRPGYTRVAVPTMKKLRSLMENGGFPEEVIVTVETRGKNLFGIGTVHEETRQAFMDELRSRSALRAIGEWWAQIPWAVQPTGVGSILARANAFRLDVEGTLPRDE